MRVARALGLVVALLLVAGSPPARAADDAAVARDAYDKGMAHFHLEEYDAAVEEWERGFRAKPVAEFLYNIAQAYRLAKQPEKALSFYQKYLRMAPEARNRAEVEGQMTALKEIVAKQKSSAESPPQQPLPAGGAVGTAPAGGAPTGANPSSGAPSSGTTTSAGTGADLVAQPAPRPVYKKPWFWGVMGGVAAVVVAGVVVGVVLGTRGSSVQSLQDARF